MTERECVCERESVGVCVGVFVCVCERERESVFVCEREMQEVGGEGVEGHAHFTGSVGATACHDP